MFRSLAVAVLLGVLGCSSTPPATQAQQAAPVAYSALVLDQVSEILRTTDKKSGAPVVVFDIDDTLVDTRSRTLPIVHEFSRDAQARKDFPDATTRMGNALLTEMRYGPSPTLKVLGITDEKVHARFKDFWVTRFFSNAYCVNDTEVVGAVDYVNRLYKQGAHVVYLTGRDVPRMLKGTKQNLKMRGFPLGKNTTLMLKPDPKMDDLAYKRDVFAKVAGMGRVIGAFENEPRNLNAMAEVFPKAVLVFIDTLHSDAPDAVTSEAHWVKNYLPNDDESSKN